MNLAKNIALTLIAAATLYGGLTNPPAPVTAEEEYAPIEQLAEQTGAELAYHEENGSIEVQAKGVAYSLLPSEGGIRMNGSQCRGDFYMKDGILYMNKGQAFELIDSPDPC
ncbi:hypothetical protein [Paenibacillus sp. PL2-23]|uniref:hypothetical protein n=1 Tax=Paenibacillus sp. PL2-23 TaxID=2100729 RepID=UPI0030F59A54